MVSSVYRRIYIIRFPKEISDKPIIYRLIKEYDVEVNILRANILPQREGILIIEMAGAQQNIKDGLEYLGQLGVTIERLATRIRRDEERCYQCGACTGVFDRSRWTTHIDRFVPSKFRMLGWGLPRRRKL